MVKVYLGNIPLVNIKFGNVAVFEIYIKDVLVYPEQISLFWNVEKTATATREDCAPGFNSLTPIVFTILANSYSDVSQIAADTLAQDAANSGAQANANLYGVCTQTTFTNVEKTATATKNDCAVGFSASGPTIYVIPANTYNAGSQIEVDTFAQDVANAGAQANANAVGTCIEIVSTFWNVEKTATATKEDCPMNFSAAGSTTYTIFANTYSADSQIAADTLAQDAANAGAQANANAVGTCNQTTFWNILKTAVATKDDCSVGYSPAGPTTYTIFANTYSAGSQIAADTLAQDAANAGAQANANAVGTCNLIPVSITKCYIGLYDGPPNGVHLTGGTITYTDLSNVEQIINNIWDDTPVTIIYKGGTTVSSSGVGEVPCGGIYYNVEKSATTFKNDCAVGYTPVGTETLIIPAGAYSSGVSQAIADTLAQDAANAGAQANANAVGTCTASCEIWTLQMNSQVPSGEYLEVNATLCGGVTKTYTLYEGEETTFCGVINTIVNAPAPENGSITNGASCDSTYRQPIFVKGGAYPNVSCDSSAGAFSTIYLANGEDFATATTIYANATGTLLAPALTYRTQYSGYNADYLFWRRWNGTTFNLSGTCSGTTCYKWRLSSYSTQIPPGEEPQLTGIGCSGFDLDYFGSSSYEFCATVEDISIDMPGFTGPISTTTPNSGTWSTLEVIGQDCDY